MTDKQPETPDELLREEIASFLLEQNRGTYPKSTYSNQADYILLKCHQSEAARIKELEVRNIELVKQCNKYIFYGADLEKQINQLNTMKCKECPFNNPQEVAIRADQNKKVGEELKVILLDNTIKNSISRVRAITDYVADNLLKPEAPEGKK